MLLYYHLTIFLIIHFWRRSSQKLNTLPFPAVSASNPPPVEYLPVLFPPTLHHSVFLRRCPSFWSSTSEGRPSKCPFSSAAATLSSVCIQNWILRFTSTGKSALVYLG